MLKLETIYQFNQQNHHFRDLAGLDACLYCKDRNGHYIAGNQFLAGVAGLVTTADVINKTDQYLCWHKEASLLQKTDTEVVSRLQSVLRIEHIKDGSGRAQPMLSFKTPVYHDDGAAGVFGVSFRQEQLSMTQLFEKMIVIANVFELDIPVESLFHHENDQSSSNSTELQLTSMPRFSLLTEREKDCIQCLIQGMTAKQTADVLNLSCRTVEAYFENIKKKLSCRKKTEILRMILLAKESSK